MGLNRPVPLRLRFHGRAVVLAAGLAAMVAARAEWAGPVQDLHYGEALFQLYQQQYFTGLVHLSAARSRDQLPHHNDDAQLLLGGMYLSYGMPQAAGRAFEAVSEAPLPEEARNRAWFFHAKMLRSRGAADAALGSLARITAPLSEGLEPERVVLHATLLHDLQRDAEAMDLLRSVDQGVWAPYARYNLAVATIEAGQVREGLALLAALADTEVDPDDDEALALRDRSNLTLGHLLRERDPEQAIARLQRVRLHSPFAESALLGLGQAYSASHQSSLALVTWSELQSRGSTVASVQRGMLATGHALEARGAPDQALAQYRLAIDTFTLQVQQLEQARQRVATGAFLDELITATPGTEMGWYWQAERLPVTAEIPYLEHLLAATAFQEGLKNLRDLAFLERNLKHWASNVGVFDTMLTTREHAYNERLPAINASYERAVAPDLRGRYQALKDELNRIESSGRAQGLANDSERESLARITHIERLLDALPADQVTAEQRDKVRLARGLLEWELETTFHPRLRAAQNAMRSLEAALAATGQRQEALQRTRTEAPAGFSGFAARIAEQRTRIAALRPEIAAAVAEQRSELIALAQAELERRRQQVRALLAQARFDAARLSDRMARAAEATP